MYAGGEVTIASASRWHLCPCSSVVYSKYTPSSHEQICSTADRLSVNIYHGTGSKRIGGPIKSSLSIELKGPGYRIDVEDMMPWAATVA